MLNTISDIIWSRILRLVNHCPIKGFTESRESRTTLSGQKTRSLALPAFFRRLRNSSSQRFKSAILSSQERRWTLSQCSKSARLQILAAEAFAAFNMLTQTRNRNCAAWSAEVSSWGVYKQLIQTHQKRTEKNPWKSRIKNWNLLTRSEWTSDFHFAEVTVRMILTCYKFWQTRNPGWKAQKNTMWPTSERFFFQSSTSCLCYLTKDWFLP